MRAQLLKLRASVHPVTDTQLPESMTMDGTPVHGLGMYSNLKRGESQTPEGFVRNFPDLREQRASVECGTSSAMKRAIMAAKVKLREASARRRRRKRDTDEEAKALYEEFLGEPVTVAVDHEVGIDEGEVDDDASKVFWEKIGTESATDSLFRHCAKEPPRFAQLGPKRSRLDRLMG